MVGRPGANPGNHELTCSRRRRTPFLLLTSIHGEPTWLPLAKPRTAERSSSLDSSATSNVWGTDGTPPTITEVISRAALADLSASSRSAKSGSGSMNPCKCAPRSRMVRMNWSASCAAPIRWARVRPLGSRRFRLIRSGCQSSSGAGYAKYGTKLDSGITQYADRARECE